MTHKAVILVLASGAGTRFDGIKQLAQIDGMPMIRKVLLNTLGTDMPVVVVLGAYADEIGPVIEDMSCEIIQNDDWQSGLSSSIRRGVEYIIEAFPNVSDILVTLGDLPHIMTVHYQSLIQKALQNPGTTVASSYLDVKGVPAIFPRTVWDQLQKLSGDKGAREVLRNRDDVLSVILPEAGRDIDTISDL